MANDIRYDEDQSEKRARTAEGVESTEGKYPDHAEDIDFGGSGAVPYPVRAAQTEEARKKAEVSDTEAQDGFIAERDSVGNESFTSGGYRAFDSGVDEVETHPAPNLDGTFAGDVKGDEAVNFADNGSTESSDRTSAAPVDGDGDNVKDPAESESSGKAAKEAAAAETTEVEDGGKDK